MDKREEGFSSEEEKEDFIEEEEIEVLNETSGEVGEVYCNLFETLLSNLASGPTNDASHENPNEMAL